MEQIKNSPEQVEKMAQEIIKFLKKRKKWDTNCGLVYNGKHVTCEGEAERHENLAGVMRFWYEGPLAKAIDQDAKIFNGIDAIMNKYGYYASPYSYNDMNVYSL